MTLQSLMIRWGNFSADAEYLLQIQTFVSYKFRIRLIKSLACEAAVFNLWMWHFSPQTRKDLLQMMLNAHHDTDINDNEKVQSYEEDPDKWKKRGNWQDLTPTPPHPIPLNFAFFWFFWFFNYIWFFSGCPFPFFNVCKLLKTIPRPWQSWPL